MLSHDHVVIAQENQPRPHFWVASKFNPPLDHVLASPILRMSFACEHELHRMLSIGEDVQEMLRIMQEEVGALVGCKPPCKSQSQRVGFKHEAGLGKFVWRSASSCHLLDVQSSDIGHQRFASIPPNLPKIGIAEGAALSLQVFRRFMPAL